MKGPGWAALLLPVALGVPTVQESFRTRVDVVQLDVSATNAQGHVAGLAAHDFVVEDQGMRQVVTVEELIDTPLDLVLVAPPLSAVNYIAADQVSRLAVGIEAFIDQVEDRDRLGVVVASPPPRRIRALESGAPGFRLEPFARGNDFYSATFDAIALGMRSFLPSGRRQALVAFTNAADFRSVLRGAAAAELAGRLGPSFVIVGMPVSIKMDIHVSGEMRGGGSIGQPVEGTISSRVLSEALEHFARTSGGLLVNLGDGQPTDLMGSLIASLRTRYVLTYALPRGHGWHSVKVRVNRRGVRVAVRERYFVR